MNELVLVPCEDSDGTRIFINGHEIETFSFKLKHSGNSSYSVLNLTIPVKPSWFGDKVPDDIPCEFDKNA